jgi:hypothetical protein
MFRRDCSEEKRLCVSPTAVANGLTVHPLNVT